MEFGTMTAHRPTSEQAERLRHAIEQARQLPPNRAALLQAFEKLTQQPGDGVPEAAMDSMIDAILGVEGPNPTDQLIERLLGSQPAGFFEAVGRVAAVTALLEHLALDLLATLIDDVPRERYEADDDLPTRPNKVLKLCDKHSAVLSSELRDQVVSMVRLLWQLRDLRNTYVHTTWSRYAGGWRHDQAVGNLIPTEGENVPDAAQESAQIAIQLLDLIQACQREQNTRTS